MHIMMINNQLSIATLVMAGVFATGCSQQQAAGGSQQSSGGSQVQADGGSQQSSGGSQVQADGGSQQSSGGSQVQADGGSQQSGSQQQVEEPQMAKEETMAPANTAPAATAPAATPNQWAHSHPANSCTKSMTHVHKYNAAQHSHAYSCGPQKATKGTVDVRALQTKLKAKGYYRGPIDGIVGPGTRSALKRFMNR